MGTSASSQETYKYKHLNKSNSPMGGQKESVVQVDAPEELQNGHLKLDFLVSFYYGIDKAVQCSRKHN